MEREEEIKRMKDELYALYQKANTKEGYKIAIDARNKFEVALRASRESPDTIVSTVLDGYWAEYYLFLKFQEEFNEGHKLDFLKRIYTMRQQVTEPDLKAELLYLESVAWSHLMNDQERASQCNDEMQKLISDGSVSILQILKGINARLTKEMAAKNWAGAIEIANEINKFPEEVLVQPENVAASANIINNRGAAQNRGNIDPVEGAIDLLQAADYYSQQLSPPAKHFGGLPGRLRESMDNLQASAIENKEVIISLIEEAKIILEPVSGFIEQSKPPLQYFQTLRVRINDIRHQLLHLKHQNSI